ncbi:hypothetical protein RZS08_46155, partial [Arthrospira platensis SPKY1]|nr:hypothetical protein [Arthrospira platensis SPKY1]
MLQALQPGQVDLIYLDPDRRPDAQTRVFRLEDAQPDILALLPRIRALGATLLLKSSPMLDLHAGFAQLGASHVWILSSRNEVKELLWWV